ncbi:MAG: hypothetical protein K2J80_03360 [Oscillospiraceae bacterium]|nr:hypothetical protein [Oscillospiraceae bacterium]
MNKIQFSANKDTNYVFHMLSAAKCGYDNAYGNYYRDLYPAEDLAVIKENERLLTVCGGEHCGFLYGTLVSEPACAVTSAKEYYTRLIQATQNNEVPEMFKDYTDIVCRISNVMIKHYDYYIDNIWENEEKKIKAYIPEVLRLFEESNFTDKAEELLDCKLLSESFTATLVTSVENGAEAIDISSEQDVFGIERTPLDAFYFIGHEFIIYLLIDALKREDAFNRFETWNLTEGLAEYYVKKITGNTRFADHRKYVELYEKCEGTSKKSAVELYRMGLQASKI